ncbi:MAG: hypothetical protein PHD95_05640 [Candidatus ainarchaeum sp.]|nr:hypothetical protein [Candidatus ainarchaeum sp.]
MAEEIPRRMKRFYRKPETEEAAFGNYDSTETREPVQKAEKKDIKDLILEDINAQEKKSPKAMEIAVGQVSEFKAKHNRLPSPDEYDQIAENIFGQLKEKEESQKFSEAKGREIKRIPTIAQGNQQAAEQPSQQAQRRGRTKAERMAAKTGTGFEEGQQAAQESSLNQSELKKLEIKDLLKEDSDELKEFEEGNEEENSESEESKEFNLSELGNEEETGEEKCPNCGKTTEEIIFCPECGSAFCEQCAKIERIGSEKKIVCPKCGKTTKK